MAAMASGLLQREKTLVFLLTMLSLAIRIWWIKNIPTQPVTDFAWYYERALDLIQGQGYGVDGSATAYWPVGYPAFLALFFKLVGPSVGLAQTLNVILTTALTPLTFWITRKASGSTLAALTAGLLVAISPQAIGYSSILASEPLFTALVLGGLAALCGKGRYMPWIGMGVLLGFATLVRPQAILLIPIFALWRFIWFRSPEDSRKDILLRAGISCLVAGLVCLPWIYRNYRIFDTFVFVSTNGGDNLFIGNNPEATGRYQPPPYLANSSIEELRLDQERKAIASAYITENPGRFISLIPAKLKYTFLTSTDVAYWGFQTQYDQLITPGMGRYRNWYLFTKSSAHWYQIGLLLLAGVGFVWTVVTRRQAGLASLGIAFVLYTGLLTIVFFGNPRFFFPAIPFMAMLGSIPLCWMGARREFRGVKESPTELPAIEAPDST